jgi:hypothetical protein
MQFLLKYSLSHALTGLNPLTTSGPTIALTPTTVNYFFLERGHVMEYFRFGPGGKRVVALSFGPEEFVLPSHEDPGLSVSADYLHKDNISGGPPYQVELTARAQADSRFLNEEHDTTFVNYLRIAMDGCGFSRAGAVSHVDSYIQFSKKIKPLLKPI